MTASGPAFERYRTQDHDEWLIRIGDVRAPAILFVPPLFEEMNRVRALIVAIMRNLAASGPGCWLPDLSGTGESEQPLFRQTWQGWRHDVASAFAHVAGRSGGTPLIVSLRGGCLLDDSAPARGWWRLAPADGASLVRDMKRAGLAGVEWAGYAPADDLKTTLEAARPAAVEPLRLVHLQSHGGQADARLPGPALWRRSEPGMSVELANSAASDIENWSRQCGA